MFARAALRTVASNNVRLASTSTKGVFKPKTLKEAWLSDKGAYPVLAVIGGAVVFATCWYGYYIFTSADVQFNIDTRKSCLRGELSKVPIEHHE